ncbi:CNP1-like family protein [Neisseria sp. ZJ106]|uniref:CNP1-like family protein n=1 Tax=Neisseria lisongii TaxID=2912188 RepID=A0ABY7RHW9_9NEIS|nr:CNP1-like family protein [Neisseria lisongii]MCF7521649.1 CNP1-like family protein [Neisseria lisongii]WCL70884.1 CNP1-like family protein [Neisseria lisongii]
MRRFSLFALALLTAAPAMAVNFSEKDTLVNTRYRETDAEKAARIFEEQQTELPPLPDTAQGNWLEVYVGEDYGKTALILTDSIRVMPSPDSSIRYVLNVRSSQGYDNLTAEGLFCAKSSFQFGGDKRSSYKIFGFGDTANKRWIQPRNNEWKLIGSALSRNDRLHGAIYEVLCSDGAPADVATVIDRLQQRAGRYAPSMIRSDK